MRAEYRSYAHHGSSGWEPIMAEPTRGDRWRFEYRARKQLGSLLGIVSIAAAAVLSGLLI